VQVYKAEKPDKKTTVESAATEPLALPETEAARAIGIGYRSLWEMRREGKSPPFVRIGNRILYPRHLLIQWLTDQATGGEK
jgi:hypothetical protein